MEQKQAKSIRGRLAEGAPNPVDVHVGARIKLRRKLLGMSQQKMADILGLTFQQVQKYEKGYNRVGASRLWDISRVLNVSMDFFFADMDAGIEEQSPMMLNTDDGQAIFHEKQDTISVDPMQRQETIELVRAYYKIRNRQLAKHLFEVIIAASQATYGQTDDDTD
ncbi:MAG: helix-turn-helix transcriptional regulator [Alphaproteobacteria bacterium]|nr:helix-turn-helix transcriptional regulator [Alphaproteobacteria bacterium]